MTAWDSVLPNLFPPPMRNPTALGTGNAPQGCGGKRTIMIGIDVSKENLSCALLDQGTHATRWECTFANTPLGVKQLLSKTPPNTPWVVEPTGRFSRCVVQLGQQAGADVRLAPPRKAKAYLASLQSRAKTDKLDAKGLAKFGLTRPLDQQLAAFPIKSQTVEQLDQLLSARKGLSRSLASLSLQRSSLPHAQEALTSVIEGIKEQIQHLDEQIAQLSKNQPEFATSAEMDKVEGIGPVTAAAVCSRLAGKQFAHPDQFVAYIGLDIAVRQSGKRKGHQGLTKQGDAELRRLLYLCAQASLRSKNSPFKAQYERELAKGLTKTAALCAIARKMARLCWSLYKHQSTYDPARVYQQPTRQSSPSSESSLPSEEGI